MPYRSSCFKIISGLFVSLLLVVVFTQSAKAEILDHYQIDIVVDLDSGSLRARETLTLNGEVGRAVELLVADNIEIERVLLKGSSFDLPFEVNDLVEDSAPSGLKELFIDLPRTPNPVVVIEFKGAFASLTEAKAKVERGVSFSSTAVIDKEGVFLPSSSYWFPRGSGARALATYDVDITLPDGFSAIMEGVSRAQSSGLANKARYTAQLPTDGINLVAGRYIVTHQIYKGIDIQTYFYKDEPALVKTYIEKTKSYIDLYAGLLPPYPYKKFAIVENFLPTGFGMPSFTLLGSKVLRLPFIPTTSLGHEFVHNWWGNGVFIDTLYGNWAEALTSYSADHLFKMKARSRKAQMYRFKALGNYTNYASTLEQPLSSYTYGTSPAQRALGYSKGLMVFHMLKNLVGEKRFWTALGKFYERNAFRQASWIEIKSAFEDVSGLDLQWFFDQWLLRSGAPALELERVHVTRVKKDQDKPDSTDSYKLSFSIRQQSPLYRLMVPVHVRLVGGNDLWTEFVVDKKLKTINIELRARPLSVELDPGVDIFRTLTKTEAPVTIASLLGSASSILVLPSYESARRRYMGAVEIIARDYGLRAVDDKEALKILKLHTPLFIFGSDVENILFEKAVPMLAPDIVIKGNRVTIDNEEYDLTRSVLVTAVRGPFGAGGRERIICLMLGSLAGIDNSRLALRMEHLTSSSYLIFTPDGKVKSGTFKGESPLRRVLR